MPENRLRFCVLSALTAQLASAAPTFNRDIAPILHKQCAPCHHNGAVAPFSLITYQDAVRHAPTIAAVTQRRIMPPWKADPGPHFKRERRLTDEQIKLIGDWATHGMSEGDPSARRVPPTFPDGWQAGQPDQVFTMPANFTLPAESSDQLRCFVIPMNTNREMYIKSFEFRPGNPRIVHHAAFFIDPTGGARKRAGSSGSYSCFGSPGFSPAVVLGGWAPGGGADILDNGVAITVPKGADLVLQLHYHPSGKPESDRSSVALRFGERSRVPLSQVLIIGNIDIPAGAARHVVRTGLTIPWDVEVRAVGPHAHYLGRDLNVTAHLPNGTVQSLIHIKDWSFNWQIEYFYETPVKLPRGTRVNIEYSYDNSAKNPENPSHPPVRVRTGEQTTDEMAVLYMSVELPRGTEESDFQRALAVEYVDQYLEQGLDPRYLYPQIMLDASQRAWLVGAIKAYDHDQSGKLSAPARQALIAALRKQFKLAAKP
jgi:hypothetical protein